MTYRQHEEFSDTMKKYRAKKNNTAGKRKTSQICTAIMSREILDQMRRTSKWKTLRIETVPKVLRRPRSICIHTAATAFKLEISKPESTPKKMRVGQAIIMPKSKTSRHFLIKLLRNQQEHLQSIKVSN